MHFRTLSEPCGDLSWPSNLQFMVSSWSTHSLYEMCCVIGWIDDVTVQILSVCICKSDKPQLTNQLKLVQIIQKDKTFQID